MRRGLRYLPADSAFPMGGLNVKVPPSQMDSRFTPEMLNFIVSDGVVEKRTGYGLLGTQILSWGSEFISPDSDPAGSSWTSTEGTFWQAISGGASPPTAPSVTTYITGDGATGEHQIGFGTPPVITSCSYIKVWLYAKRVSGTPDLRVRLWDGTAFTPTKDITLSGSAAWVSTIYDSGDFGSVAVPLNAAALAALRLLVTVITDLGPDVEIYEVRLEIFGNNTARPVMALREFETAAGAKHLLAFTTTGQFRYDTSTNNWVDITRSVDGLADVWVGDEDDTIDTTIGWDDAAKYIFVTNGVDTPRQWSGTGNFADVVWNIPSFVTCKTLEIVNGYLVLGNVETSGSNPQDVVWSDTSAFTQWVTGNSGSVTLYDVVGPIETIVRNRDRLLIYTSGGSVVAMEHVGGTSIFSFREAGRGIDPFGARCVAEWGGTHFVLTPDTIMAFDGTNTPASVGEPVEDQLVGLLDYDYPARSFVFVDDPRARVYFVFPRSATLQRAYLAQFDSKRLQRVEWSALEWTDRITAMGMFQRDDIDSWNGDGESWNSDTSQWNDSTSSAGSPVVVVRDSVGNVYLLNPALGEDSGDAYTGVYHTIDFSIPEVFLSQNARWLEIEFEGKGSTVDVDYSTTGGSAWVVGEVGKVLTAMYARYSVLIDAVGRTLRVRFSDSSGNLGLALRWVRVWFKEREAR